MPFFSIVVLAYEVGAYLNECVDSILNQTFQDFEIILINPPSKDKTGEICEEYIKSDKRIKLIKCENKGQLINRIKGFSAAQGHYLLCVDGDDWWKPFTLETIYIALKRSICDWVIFGYEKVEDGKAVEEKLHTFPDEAIYKGEEKKEVYEKLLCREELNSACTKVMAKELFLKIKQDFEDCALVRNGEDLLYCLYVADQAEKILYLDISLYCYRRRRDSVVRTFSLNEVKDRNTIMQHMEKMMVKWNMADEAHYEILYRSMAVFFMRVIFRCSTSAFPYKEKKKVFTEIRNDRLYKKTLPFQRKTEVSMKQWAFVRMFRINDRLLCLCGDVYRTGRKIWHKYKKRR